MPKLYPEEIKQQALILRQQGFTYSEIQNKLERRIPKSTLNGWFKDIILSESLKFRIIQKIFDSGNRGRKIALQAKRSSRKRLINSIYSQTNSDIKIIDKMASKIILSMLYLGEGGKQGGCVTLGNSDPRIIQIFVTLLRTAFEIDESKLHGKVQCRAD